MRPMNRAPNNKCRSSMCWWARKQSMLPLSGYESVDEDDLENDGKFEIFSTISFQV